MMLGSLGVAEVMLVLVFAGFGLLCTAFWVWMLVHAILNKGLTDNERLLWVVVIALTHVIGALIYLFVGLPKRTPARPAERTTT